ncbi:MAG: GNAT family N-acetyltransferase [Hyphomicrobiaceae bacterium]|nr:MAG: GNAT family N-acetyltransferase [Hyphomicrobiaceae bacterium]
MLDVEIKSAQGLSERERRAWDELQAADRAYESPYFSRAFFEAVARHAQSTRVAVMRANGEVAGFFPFHHGPLGLARPLAGPVSDCHGPLLRKGAGIDPAALVKAAGFNLLSMRHADGATRLFAGALSKRHAMHVIDLGDGFKAYEEGRRALAKSAFRAIRVRTEKAEKQYGRVSHVFCDARPETLRRLYAWKSEQYHATGQIDVLSVGWVRRLVEDLFESKGGAVSAQLSSLWFGDRLAAAHLGLRTRTAMHYWFPGYDPELSDLSPGNILLHRMAEAAAGEKVRAIHLGPGDYRYKTEFANASLPLAEGVICGTGVIGSLAKAGNAMIETLGRKLPARFAHLPSGLARRIDRQLAFRSL